MKKIFFLILALLVILSLVIANIKSNKSVLTSSHLLKLTDNDFVFIKINDAKIQAEIARSPQKRALGLAGRQKLKNNQGMLFIFEKEGNYGFWMKGMLFNIDIIFIKDDQVVDIAENMPYPTSESNIAGVSPKQKANLALEVNAGWAKKYNIKTGDKILYFK